MYGKFSLAFLGFILLGCNGFESPEKKPERLIVFIANGAGFYHMEAASLYKTGKSEGLIFEQFPVKLGMSTYSFLGSYDPDLAYSDFHYLKSGASDSAAAATALASGTKTHNNYLGIDPQGQPLSNLVEKTYRSYRSAGLISTESYTSLGLAAFATQSKALNMQQDISNNLINKSLCTVIIGAGNPWYDDRWTKRLENPLFSYIDQANWQALVEGKAGTDLDRDGQPDPWVLIQSKLDFESIVQGLKVPDRLFGLVQAHTSLQQSRPGNPFALPYSVSDNDLVPSLASLSLAALEVLDKNPRGFSLIVEAASIETASRLNQSGRMIEELLALEETIQRTLIWLIEKDYLKTSLVVVLSNYETGYLTGTIGQHAAPKSRGKGKMPELYWHSFENTNSIVPVYAIGLGSKALMNLPKRLDKRHGSYLDNAELGQLLSELLE